MPTKDNLNTKAVHELVLYYLRERITLKNLEVKHLIATDLHEWFVFNAQDFEKIFAKNKKLVKDFEAFEEDRLSGTTTDFFYSQIAKPFIDELEDTIPVSWFDIRDFETVVKNDSKADDNKLIGLFKILSPEHLLKLPFTNDSNTLDKRFYNELLHIIGLEETKEGSKKLIGRKAEESRNNGSLIENALNILRYEDCLNQLEKLSEYGANYEDQLYNIALELTITWINRILFIKLLEGQLIKYHQGDESYKFLNSKLIANYDALNKLFFHVLAVKESERLDHVKEKYGKIPYLNSSLFEPNQLEHKTIRISNLEDDFTIPILSSTVLKDSTGKKITGEINPLKYLIEFLDSYDFSSEGAEDISEENKPLINASVLGLIFEKINGYKDGSFFTPGFITMYMCRETIRRAVVQKFNEAKNWNCENLDDLYNKIEDKKEANEIINSLKIVDPAVGSGHFLVSALNEIISIKSELKILSDAKGKVFRDYHVEVINDELVITDEDGEFFEYHPKNPESQRIQETLFHEKQTIIENCLFGVDINQNSVKICRLRLWIELLKNAYYRPDSGYSELETLPNIDINIKCGNSLISRYQLDADIKSALAKSKWTIESYRLAIMAYRNAESKEEKASMRRLIDEIKSDFESEVARNDKRLLKSNKLKGELSVLTGQQSLFELSKKEKAEWEKKVKKIADNLDKLESELEEIKNNKIYENAFEWRFEFPEVLNDEGDYKGFDVVIGNPPYGVTFNPIEKTHFKSCYNAYNDIYTLFIEKGFQISKHYGRISLIIPIFWLTGEKYIETRDFLRVNGNLDKGIILPYDIFIDAYIDTGIFFFQNKSLDIYSQVHEFEPKEKVDASILQEIDFSILNKDEWDNTPDRKIIFNPISRSLLNKLNKFPDKIEKVTDSIRGILASAADYSDSKIDIKYRPVFQGKIERYFIDKGAMGYVRYGENLKEKPSSPAYFQEERILIRRIVNRRFRLMATIVNQEFVVKKDIYVFKSNHSSYSNKYLLSIINSRLISYLKTKGSASAKKDDFTQLTLGDIRKINIPEPTKLQVRQIEDIVDQLLEKNTEDKDEKFEILEKALDRLIYEIYDLSDDEIEIIEESI